MVSTILTLFTCVSGCVMETLSWTLTLPVHARSMFDETVSIQLTAFRAPVFSGRLIILLAPAFVVFNAFKITRTLHTSCFSLTWFSKFLSWWRNKFNQLTMGYPLKSANGQIICCVHYWGMFFRNEFQPVFFPKCCGDVFGLFLQIYKTDESVSYLYRLVWTQHAK